MSCSVELSIKFFNNLRAWKFFFLWMGVWELGVGMKGNPFQIAPKKTIVGILTFMSMKNSILGLSEPEKS